MRYIAHPLYRTIFGQLWGVWDLQRGDWLRQPDGDRRERWRTYSAVQAAAQAIRLNGARP